MSITTTEHFTALRTVEEVIAAELGAELTAIITDRARAAVRLEKANAESDLARQAEQSREARELFADTVERLTALGEAYWPTAERLIITDRGDLIAVIDGGLRRVVTLHEGMVCEDVVTLPAIACETDAIRHVCGCLGAHAGDHECQYCEASWPGTTT